MFVNARPSISELYENYVWDIIKTSLFFLIFKLTIITRPSFMRKVRY